MMKLRLIDAHCHIFSNEFDADRINVLNHAADNGVVGVISSSIRYDMIVKSINELDKLKNEIRVKLFLSFGFNPTVLDNKEVLKVISIIEEYYDLLVAIGEIGLDYYYIREHESREKQREIFTKFINLSKKLDLPLVIHSRSAGKYAVEMLLENN
ncbi:MAG: TatD family hydrolase, partial [Candidatus Odinarchaeia archaeon]